MNSEHRIIARVYGAKENDQQAEALIRDYIPFIKKEASKFLLRLCTEQDDAYSIGLMAFHEAVLGYRREKGAFLSYAALTIRSRLIDEQRRQARHEGSLSLDAGQEDEGGSLHDSLADPDDPYERSAALEATQQEIRELSRVMADFGLKLSDVADNSPRQERTLEACAQAVRYAAGRPQLLDELLRSRKLPLAELCRATGLQRKTLERHRKYLMAMLLIQTNGYEIIRGHIRHVLKGKGGTPA